MSARVDAPGRPHSYPRTPGVVIGGTERLERIFLKPRKAFTIDHHTHAPVKDPPCAWPALVGSVQAQSQVASVTRGTRRCCSRLCSWRVLAVGFHRRTRIDR